MKWRIKDLVDKAYEISYETSMGSVHRGARAIFANQNVKISKGQTALVKIKPVTIPMDHLSFMSAYARHPLGNVVSLMDDDAPKKLDKPRTVSLAVFLAWEDGRIEKDDVIGVVDFMLAERGRA